MKKYVNAKDVLPEALVKEIQKYVQGQHMYVPQVERKSWGTGTGIREELELRNAKIVKAYQGGVAVAQLAEMYALSEERIRGIIYDNQIE
jgi:Mor family transcriptional regulator